MKVIKKGVLFIGGMLLLAFGIAVSTVSGLGISPLNCLAYVISEILKVQMGYITMVLYIVYVLLEIPVKGKKFKAADLLQILCAILFGFFVNLTKQLLSGIVRSYYWQRLLCTLISMVLIAAGTTIYVIPDIVLQAPEGLILAICDRWHFSFGHVKTGFDITIVVLAFLTGVIFAGHIIGIREGTLIAAIGVAFLSAYLIGI